MQLQYGYLCFGVNDCVKITAHVAPMWHFTAAPGAAPNHSAGVATTRSDHIPTEGQLMSTVSVHLGEAGSARSLVQAPSTARGLRRQNPYLSGIPEFPGEKQRVRNQNGGTLRAKNPLGSACCKQR